MSFNTKEKCNAFMRKSGFRFTRGRKALIEILENEHLTFKEIQNRLAERGYANVSSVYNMLEFFVDNKIVSTLHINGVKYYDLCLENKMHHNNSYIHMLINQTNDIVEISNETLSQRIKETIERDYNVEIDSVKITISANQKENF